MRSFSPLLWKGTGGEVVYYPNIKFQENTDAHIVQLKKVVL
jgi:hypothetical protein